MKLPRVFLRWGSLGFGIGIFALIFGLVSGEFSFAEIGEKAPLQMFEDATTNAVFFVAVLLPGQFVMAGLFGSLGRSKILERLSDPQFASRVRSKQKMSYTVRLMVWFLDLPIATDENADAAVWMANR